MRGHSAVTSFSGASLSRGAADERDTTSAAGDGDMDMCCRGENEASVAVGVKRKSPSDSQHFESAENHTQEPKRARPGTRKIDAIEEMVDKLTNNTERLFETPLIRLNESDAERKAQYAAVNNQLAAVKKRIKYLERGTAQLQQQRQGHHELGGDASTILNRSSNVNATHTEKGGMHGQSRPPQRLRTTTMAASRKARAATRPLISPFGQTRAAIIWSNTFEDLGSDHRVLCVTMGEDEGKMDGCQKARVVNWDKFREQREREKQEGLIEDIRE
ncbi:hypothetical protein MRX96_003407 [Rhipicephalus microplus]